MSTDERPCEIGTCDNLAAPGSRLCWAHLRRRRLGLPMQPAVRRLARDSRERLLREVTRYSDDLEAPAGLDHATHEARAERRLFRAVRAYARECMRDPRLKKHGR
jgi:hypothetical protein